MYSNREKEIAVLSYFCSKAEDDIIKGADYVVARETAIHCATMVLDELGLEIPEPTEFGKFMMEMDEIGLQINKDIQFGGKQI